MENYSEELTADVSRAVPDVARRIIEDLKLGIVIKSDNLWGRSFWSIFANT